MDKQKILDLLLQTINATDSNPPKGNYIKELRFINRKNCKDMWGRQLANGEYVRIIFADGERTDGYYDICVDADSGFAMIKDVIRYLDKNLL